MQHPSVTVRLAAEPHPLERRAADELCRYIRVLFGFTPAVTADEPTAGKVFHLGTTGSHPRQGAAARLPVEGYLIRRRRQGKLDVCDLIGGSPIAVLWAVYEVVEQWGVHYLMHRDVLPTSVGRFRLPERDVVRRPVFQTRAFRIINEAINATVTWSLAEHQALFDQLVKLRFNTVYAQTYSFHPWGHWSFRGIQRRQADICYGFEHLIHERSIGKELLGLGHYTNAELRGCQTYEQRLTAGKRFMHGLIAAAQQRGLRFVYGHELTSLPQEVKRHLARWSRAARLPPTGRTCTHPHSLGLARDGGESRFGHLMTPLNPVYVELVESWLEAQLREYPQIDGLLLNEQEFPAAAAGVERCWRQLDQRYGLEKRFKLADLLKQGAKLKFHSPGRGLLQTKGAIVMIRLLDLVINEHQIVDRALGRRIKIYPQLMNHLLLPVLEHVFDPDRVEVVTNVDYTPSDVAQRIDVLAFAKDSRLKLHLVTSLEDDNVGFLPQAVTEPMHRIVRKMRRYGLCGYWSRHWQVSKLEPTMGYLVDACWDRAATPARSLRRQVGRICGQPAVPPMLKAWRILERALPYANQTVPIGFMMPTLMRLTWEQPLPCPATVLGKLIRTYDRALEPLRQAHHLAAADGKTYVNNMVGWVEFGRCYLEVVLQVRRAKECFDRAREEKRKDKRFDIDRYDDLLAESARGLRGAIDLLEHSLRVWVQQAICDPSDRATLAGLNVYALDYLRGKATEVRLTSEAGGIVL